MQNSFKDIAAYYDALYVNAAQYATEAAQVVEFARMYQQSAGKSLLDIACGTGAHLPYLQQHFDCSGLDLSPEMLQIARDKFPYLPFYEGNLIDFSLERQFDVQICLYGSIGFVQTEANLNQALQTLASHLAPGGLLILTPWQTQEEFSEMTVSEAINQPEISLARLEVVKRVGPGQVIVDMHHLIGFNGEVHYRQEQMSIGLFSETQYRAAIRAAGLELVERYTGPQIMMGAFLCRKPLS